MKPILWLCGALSVAILGMYSIYNPLVKTVWPIYAAIFFAILIVGDYLTMANRDRENKFYRKLWLDEMKRSAYLSTKLMNMREDGEEWKDS